MSLKTESKECNRSKDGTTVVVDHLCCKICYEPYEENGGKEPKVMACGHSICLQCAGMIYKKHSHIKCPFCKKVAHVRPDTLPKNFDMVCMLPHYPQLPPNQKPYQLEVEKMKVQWNSEKTFFDQLSLKCQEAHSLVTQTQNHLYALTQHAESLSAQKKEVGDALKATEATLRLFIDLYPDDPILASLSEKLFSQAEEKKLTLFETIREIKAANRARQSMCSAQNNVPNNREVNNVIDLDGAPPAPPHLRRLPRYEANPPAPPPPHNVFARSIADAASRMHRVNNPESDWSEDIIGSSNSGSALSSSFVPQQQQLPQQEHAVLSPRATMLNLIRSFGN